MIIIAVATFAFFIYFGTLIQWAFDCTFETALNVSACTTGLGLVILIAALK